VVEGRTSREIAAMFGVKPSSIHTYRSRIMAKLQINDIPSLVRFAIRHGLIRP
jgi:DNA-binding CsgD family transcriptional regulator